MDIDKILTHMSEENSLWLSIFFLISFLIKKDGHLSSTEY
jgi:hypothetical protein